MKISGTLLVLLLTMNSCALNDFKKTNNQLKSFVEFKFFGRKMHGGRDYIAASVISSSTCEQIEYLGRVTTHENSRTSIESGKEIAIALAYEITKEESVERTPTRNVFIGPRYDTRVIPARTYSCSGAIAFTPEENKKYRLYLDEFEAYQYKCEAHLEKYNELESRWELENSQHVCARRSSVSQ